MTRAGGGRERIAQECSAIVADEPRHLQAYVDASQEPLSEGFDATLRWRLHHAKIPMKTNMSPGDAVRPFSERHTPPLVRVIVPAKQSALLRCAVYLLPYGGPPTWFELEYAYWGDLRRGDHVIAMSEVLKRVAVTPLGTGRPRVTWSPPPKIVQP